MPLQCYISMRFSDDDRFQVVRWVKSTKNTETQVALHYFKITQSVQITASTQETSDSCGVGSVILKGECNYFIVNS